MIRALAAGLLLLLGMAGARAQDAFDLPGLEADSSAYADQLTAKFPAGGTPQGRAQAEARAAAAIAKGDWNAAAAALEARVGMGDAKPEQWLGLARAELRRNPPDPAHALAAAWQNYQAMDTAAPEIPALLVVADALAAQNRPAQQLQALQAVVERAPENGPDRAKYKQMLADASKAAGLLVARVRTEVETDPPRACIAFTVPPARRPDFHPQDWVKLDPPAPDAAVTREGDQICVSGLRLGATTRVVLAAGMPGEGGVSLVKATPVAVAMGNRASRLAFDNRLFLLPRGQAPAITLTSVNLSAVKLRLVRVSERAMLPWTRDNQLGQPLESYAASQLEDNGKTVWEGRAEIPKFATNALIRTALPLPDMLQGPGREPGLYALLVRPGDGQPNDAAFAAQMILRTDLAPTVWRGTDGLTVQMRGYSDAKPRAGVRVDLLAHDNDILASATTNADGVARFAAPLLAGTGPLAPAAIHGALDADLVALDLNAAAFDLSDRGVEGMADPGPLDAFVYTDRGIYRPGETVQVMALLRDAAGQPADIPARIRVKRPNGEIFAESVPQRSGDAAENVAVTLSNGAASGIWSIEVLADPDRPPIGRAEFRVDSFVPDRMAVELGPDHGPIAAATAYDIPVAARFLYGAPAAGLTGKATLRLEVNPEPPPALAGYRIGLDGEEYAPDSRDISLPTTDANGHTTLPIRLTRAPDTTHPVRAAIDVEIDDPSGHAAHAHTTIPVRPEGRLIGIKPGFDQAVDAGAEAGFDVAAIDADGTRVAVRAKLRLVRERPDWRLVMNGQLARFEVVWRDEPLETRDITIPADGVFHYARRLDFGRYRLEVAEANGLAATSVRFRAGWVASESPDVPDKVDVSADRKMYPPGASARIHIAPPFGGEATVAVMTDRVFSLRTLTVPAGGTDIDVPVDPAWGPGAYVAVHLFRAGTDTVRPARAIGLAWVGIDPAARTLAVTIDAPDKVVPRARTVIPVHAAPGAWVTLAAVDEGILRLTDYASPDPAAHFLGRRKLGLDIRDDWGRLIAPAEGNATALHQGGDESAGGIREIPQQIVSLFQPSVQAGADGVATIPLDFPDFNGQVRLMAVVWQGGKIGSASKDMLVRDALVADPLLPRFLAPGDDARFAVLMQNLELPAGEAAVTISVDGPLVLDGPDRLAATLAPNGQAVPFTGLRGTGAGRGVIHLDVTGPGNFHIRRETAILVRPARGRTTDIAGVDLAAGAEDRLAPPLDRFIAGTWRAQASFGGAVRYDAAALVQALADYPLGCLEQATSKGFPLTVMADGPMAGPDRAARLQQAIASVLDKQRYDGGFGLWSANADAEPWLSAYTTEFLLRARAAGATVPEAALKDALKFQADGLDGPLDTPEHLAVQAYRLYVLALAGQPRAGAARVLAERTDKLPTPLARAQLGAALARSNDRPRAEAAFAAALAAPARRPWDADYGSALRDQAAIAVLLKESGLLANRVPTLISQMPGSDLKPEALNTQEEAWAAAAAAVLGRGVPPASITVNGAPLAPASVIAVSLTAPASARNTGMKSVFQTVSVAGVPSVALPAARAQMRVSRLFYNLDGSPLDLGHLPQNTVFVLLVQGQAEDGQDHRAMLLQGLPAGWEIAGRFPAGDVAGMSWLGTLSETEAQPAADYRFAAVIPLTGEKPAFRVAVKLRAVTPGNYEIPGAELSDMYRPGVYARQAANRITVLPAQ